MKSDLLDELEMKDIDIVASVYFLVHMTLESDKHEKPTPELIEAAKSFVGTRIGWTKYEKIKNMLHEKLPTLLSDMLLEEALEKMPDNVVH